MSGTGFADYCKALFFNLRIQTVFNIYKFDLALYSINNSNVRGLLK